MKMIKINKTIIKNCFECKKILILKIKMYVLNCSIMYYWYKILKNINLIDIISLENKNQFNQT